MELTLYGLVMDIIDETKIINFYEINKKNININKIDRYILIQACNKGFFKFMQLLIDNGFNIQLDDDNHMFYHFVLRYKFDAIDFLVYNGLKITNRMLVIGVLHLKYKYMTDEQQQNIKNFIIRYMDIKDEYIKEILYYFCQNGFIDEVYYLINNGVNIFTDDDKALFISYEYENYDIMKLLMDYGSFMTEEKLIKHFGKEKYEATKLIFNVI